MELVLEDRKFAIPVSPAPTPRNKKEALTVFFMRFYAPMNPFFRWIVTGLRIMKHPGRQHYLFGKLLPGKSVREFLSYLEGKGFGNHFMAWNDPGEIISVRRLDGFEYQYHVRIFSDGEVRGHHEFTPEAYPIKHLKGTESTEGREYFIELFSGWIAPADN